MLDGGSLGSVLGLGANGVHVQLERLTIEGGSGQGAAIASGDFGAVLLLDGIATALLTDTLVTGNRGLTSALAVRDLGRAGHHAPIAVALRGTRGREPAVIARDSLIDGAGAISVDNGSRYPGRVELVRTRLTGRTNGSVRASRATRCGSRPCRRR